MPCGKVRAILSVLILFHLGAVALAPYSLYQPPLAQDFRRVYEPYLQATLLDNGYQFFAPDPGPSHLVKYEVVKSDGTRVKGIFPDRAEHRPRLLYHRHFMLSEFLNALAPPDLGEPPADGPGNGEAVPPEDARLADRRRAFEACCDSYARHLLAEYEGQEVTLTLVRHHFPGPVEVAEQGMRLDDPRLYQERVLGTYRKDSP
jgi:hypothetical protein